MSAKRSLIFFNNQYVPGEKGGSRKDPLKTHPPLARHILIIKKD